MQPVFSRNQRERPLQKSMFLTTTQQYGNRNNSVQYQYQGLLQMKRSNINMDSNKQANYQLNNQSYHQNQQFTQHTNQILNFNQTPRHKQSIKNHLNNINTNTSIISQEINIKQLLQKLDKVTGLVQNHQQILKHLNFNNLKQKHSLQIQQINQIQTKLKQNIIPTLISQSNKQIYEHLFNSKFQIQTLRDQLELINQKYKSQFNNFIKETNFIGNININSSSSLSNEKIQQSASIYSLENKILEIQKNIQHKDQYLKTFIQTEIQKNKKQLRSSLRSSNIQSTISPILIQYQQFFTIKNINTNTTSNKLSFVKNKQQTQNIQILINSCVYQIDKQGFLLDNQNRYIVDQKGSQIKLDQKHIILLKQHHILTN